MLNDLVVVVVLEGFRVGGEVGEGVEVHRSFIIFRFLLDAHSSSIVRGTSLQPSGATMLNGGCLVLGKSAFMRMAGMIVMVDG